jgi:hypothetical protein
MSRIGKEPVILPAGVTAKVEGQKVTVKGKLGELAYVMHDGITAKVEEGKIVIERKDDTIKNFHGLARALVAADETTRAALKKAGCMTRDSRMKERKKPGQPGARKRFQFSKR